MNHYYNFIAIANLKQNGFMRKAGFSHVLVFTFITLFNHIGYIDNYPLCVKCHYT
ncbi:hypothetical protein NIASO_03005 [Niabella soli DSM 19437]|uniref:Uncharacterized protein n=1 Tax=Niabella soli DSM 19437 TaxID=929713 RepID=W0F760_9BACT|nr:hypothetical protein NIASO_03005 [Niabella soli DSM 19437]